MFVCVRVGCPDWHLLSTPVPHLTHLLESKSVGLFILQLTRIAADCPTVYK